MTQKKERISTLGGRPVSRKDDRAELEADRLARSVLNRLNRFGLARIETKDSEEKSANSDGSAYSQGGQELPRDTRKVMERGFGHNFGSVKIHNNRESWHMCRGIAARAATVGSHIHFGRGHFQPNADEGKALIAHELAHITRGDTGSMVARSPENDEPRYQDSIGVDYEFEGSSSEREALRTEQIVERYLDKYTAQLGRLYRNLLEAKLNLGNAISRSDMEFVGGSMRAVATNFMTRVALRAIPSAVTKRVPIVGELYMLGTGIAAESEKQKKAEKKQDSIDRAEEVESHVSETLTKVSDLIESISAQKNTTRDNFSLAELEAYNKGARTGDFSEHDAYCGVLAKMENYLYKETEVPSTRSIMSDIFKNYRQSYLRWKDSEDIVVWVAVDGAPEDEPTISRAVLTARKLDVQLLVGLFKSMPAGGGGTKEQKNAQTKYFRPDEFGVRAIYKFSGLTTAGGGFASTGTYDAGVGGHGFAQASMNTGLAKLINKHAETLLNIPMAILETGNFGKNPF